MAKNQSRKWLNQDEQYCVICGRAAKIKIAKHRNPNMSEHFNFHTECIQDKTKMDGNPIDVLRMMNIPYVTDLWDYSVEVEGGDLKKALSKYLQMMGPKTQYPDFMSSDFTTSNRREKFEITDDMIAKWGPDLLQEDYQELENNYSELARIQEPRTHLEKSKYIDNCWLKKQTRRALMSGQANDIQKLQAAYQASLKDLGLDSAALNERNSSKSLGERIKEWEEEKPVPELSKEFKDVDKIERYFKKFFVTPLIRNFGLASDKDVNELGNYSSDDIPGSDSHESE